MAPPNDSTDDLPEGNEPHDPGDVLPPRLLRRFRRRRGSAPFSGEEKEQDAVLQTQFLVVAATVLLFLIWLALRAGYGHRRDMPLVFYGPLLTVIFFGTATAFPEAVAYVFGPMVKRLSRGTPSAAPKRGDERDTASKRAFRRLHEWRRRWQPRLVYVFTALTGAGFLGLVWKSGLAVESPYIPLVTAPAVFGPFVARDDTTVRYLLGIVGGLLVFIALALPTETCGGCVTTRDAVHELKGASDPVVRQVRAELVKAEDYRPSRWVFVTVGFVFLAIAGVISSVRMQNERDLKRDNLTLESERDTLDSERDKLIEHRQRLYDLAVAHSVPVPADLASELGQTNEPGSEEDA